MNAFDGSIVFLYRFQSLVFDAQSVAYNNEPYREQQILCPRKRRLP